MKSVKILNRTYKIIYTDDKSKLEVGNEAQVDYSKRLITVLTKNDGEQYSQEWIKDSLLHEVAHAFMVETGQDDLNDERHAELLSKFATFVQGLE